MTGFRSVADSIAIATTLMVLFSASLPARPVPTQHHFRLDSLREPLSVVSAVQERDGGTLEVSLRDANGKQDRCEFNYKMNKDHGPNSAFGRLYTDDWLVPLGSPEQEKIARAVCRYVLRLGKQDVLADRLLSAVAYLDQLQKPATVTHP